MTHTEFFFPNGMRGVTTKKLTLEQMQEMVGGYIEIVPSLKEGHVLIVNEEGLLQNLPLNPAASELAGRPIVGVALQIHRDDLD